MMKTTLPHKNDILIAYKTLCLAPGLSRAAVLVGAILLDHFNRTTGRCDPSVKRLADLSGLSRSTVLKATHDLVMGGWFDKQSHGGSHNTCSYQPNWVAFTKHEGDWRERFDADSKVRRTRPLRFKNSDLDSPKNKTQTMQITNPKNQSDDCALDKQIDKFPEVREPSQSPTSTNNKNRKGLMRGEAKTDVQRSILLPINGGRQPNRRDVVSNNPDRITSKLFERNPKLWAIDGLPERVAEAERKAPGAGAAIVHDALKGLFMPIAVKAKS